MRIVLCLPLLMLAVPVAAKMHMVPPELADKVYLSDDLGDVGEPSLWSSNDLGHFKARYRLTIMGIRCIAYTYRIDERVHGSAAGLVKSWNHCKEGAPFDVSHFHVRAQNVQALKDAFAGAGLWRISPQFWQNTKTGNYICIDGEEMTFERRDASDYRVAEANAQCEAPAKLVDAARKFVTLAGDKTALRLLD